MKETVAPRRTQIIPYHRTVSGDHHGDFLWDVDRLLLFYTVCLFVRYSIFLLFQQPLKSFVLWDCRVSVWEEGAKWKSERNPSSTRLKMRFRTSQHRRIMFLLRTMIILKYNDTTHENIRYSNLHSTHHQGKDSKIYCTWSWTFKNLVGTF